MGQRKSENNNLMIQLTDILSVLWDQLFLITKAAYSIIRDPIKRSTVYFLKCEIRAYIKI